LKKTQPSEPWLRLIEADGVQRRQVEEELNRLYSKLADDICADAQRVSRKRRKIHKKGLDK
jgi:hypothetical protein